jgi:hypothetical protein
MIILVLAGNKKEFDNYGAELSRKVLPKLFKLTTLGFKIDSKEYKYISFPNQMRGYHGVEVECIGTFFERKDAGEFRDLIPMARMK